MFGLKKVILGVVFLAGCSGAGQADDKSAGSKVVATGGQGSTSDPHAGEPETDICAAIFIIPDGKCEPSDSPYAKCDPDCHPDNGGGEAGAANDPCAAIDVAPDGTCDSSQQCDPDCPVDIPVTDVCANIRIAPDGTCDPNSPYAACDPDCAPPEVNDPCAGIDYIPDGKCSGNECDPDCLSK